MKNKKIINRRRSRRIKAKIKYALPKKTKYLSIVINRVSKKSLRIFKKKLEFLHKEQLKRWILSKNIHKPTIREKIRMLRKIVNFSLYSEELKIYPKYIDDLILSFIPVRNWLPNIKICDQIKQFGKNKVLLKKRQEKNLNIWYEMWCKNYEKNNNTIKITITTGNNYLRLF
jgi:hypothetical protein